MPDDFVQVVKKDVENGLAYIVTNYLFHFPLYAYYVFMVELYEEGDIVGLLISPPFDVTGPFTTFDDAAAQVQLELDNSKSG